MAAEHELSAVAAQRMDALLPELLDTLRTRVRRARRRRAIVAILLMVLPVPLLTWRRPAPAAPPIASAAVARGWTEVRDDPGVRTRCEVETVVRSAWFAGDDEVQELLRAAARPAGLVRAGNRVFVSAAALDPWPSVAP